MPRYKAVISYDGSAFYGFALQKHKPSVLGALQDGFSRVGIRGEILGASRTDKGVHSTGQVISFESYHFKDIKHLQNLLNAKLYPHIAVRRLERVSEDFHPRFHALWRAYRFLLSSHAPSPFQSAYMSYEKIGDRALFQSALSMFQGRHNFALFKKNGSFTRDSIRDIFRIFSYQHKDLDVVYIKGNGFLRSQVRLMVGAALSVSRGELSLESLQEQIQAKKRHYNFPISPNGLYLCGVGYSKMKK